MEIEKGNGTGVCVLLSAYKPDLKFFAAQLDSIDEQTFPVTLLVRNDCPESASIVIIMAIKISVMSNRSRHYSLWQKGIT